MYTNVIKTVSQAYCHLFFHCCMGDYSPVRKEAAFTAARFVEGGLNSGVDLESEMKEYEACRPFITDEFRFLYFIMGTIRPANPLTLYFYCTEVILTNGIVTKMEDQLLKKLALVLDLSHSKQDHAKEIIREVKYLESTWAYPQ